MITNDRPMGSTRAVKVRFPQERQRQLAELIAVRGQVSIGEVIAHFDVSGPTARRDLAHLSRAGLAVRTHGGVVAPGREGSIEPLFMEKLRVHQAVKARIGAAAAALVENGQTVLLDSGTTALAVARNLAGRPLSVVTMDLKVAEAAATGETDVSILGGRVRNGYFSLVGDWTARTFAGLRCDVFFLAADAVDEDGVSNVTPEEAEVKRAALASAARTILIADHSKFGRREPFPVCRPDEIERLITDRKAAADAARYRSHFKTIALH